MSFVNGEPQNLNARNSIGSVLQDDYRNQEPLASMIDETGRTKLNRFDVGKIYRWRCVLFVLISKIDDLHILYDDRNSTQEKQ
jgi:hypothetical protein